MGEIAARLADRAWVTSDNPRSERPQAIVDEVVAGVRRVPGAEERYVAEPDRKLAISGALAWAQAGDTVMIAGKGHETYQIIGEKKLHFDDREKAKEVIKKILTTKAPRAPRTARGKG
jgi:UDP-N-acetylmuramoyl-L-alanyl-D-glutamate--2,6-diaminopimelate ligase